MIHPGFQPMGFSQMGFINRTVLVHNGTLSVRIQIQIHGTDLLMDSSGIKAHFLRKKRLHKTELFLRIRERLFLTG